MTVRKAPLPSPASAPPQDGKYRRLVQKYEALVHKLERRTQDPLGAYTLATWALRTSGSAIALVRGGRVIVSNTCWDELPLADPRSARGWRELGAEASPALPLRDLTVAFAARLLSRRRHGPDLHRFERSDGGQVLEVRFERVDAPPAAPLVFVLAHDVTASVRAEQELGLAREALFQKQRLEALGVLASGVSHDLNNLLNVLSLRLHLLGADPAVVATQGENVRALTRITQDAAATVGRLQEFARRRRDVPNETLDVKAVVEGACALARPELSSSSALRGVEVRIECALHDGLPPVRGSPGDFRQVLLNLVLNARDAMPNGGVVTVRARLEGSVVLIEVRDQGTGIAAEHLPRLFDPFFTTKGKRGTGLGLSIAYSVVSRSGGDISAANAREGGAVFTLRLPVAQEQRRTAKPAAPQPATGPALPRRVLLVDDEVDNLDVAREYLELCGQEVECAKSGREAIERVGRGRPFDLVLCDVGMPEMNGWQTVARLHELSPSTAIYMLTGWANEIHEKSCPPGVRGILAKPVDPERLQSLLA